MIEPRKIETDEGIQDNVTVKIFDDFARNMRDKGWNNVDVILKSGITGGKVLEIGPGPGYVGLEWLKKTSESGLSAIEISNAMILLAEKNAKAYGLQDRVHYIEGNCMQLPFDAMSFDAVFSNGSLHEWKDPIKAFNEIHRVLVPGGRLCITDLRRDVGEARKWMIYHSTFSKEIRPGLLTSLGAACTVKELQEIIRKTAFHNLTIQEAFFGLCISGTKQ
jgi:ubiquinone/menaquinone biosynthesis C-methylase UbiE